MPKKLRIDPEFQSFIPPLTASEFQLLEADCLNHGIRDPIVTWRGLIVDGHNRFRIADKYGLLFEFKELDFPDREAVKQWMFEHQIGRRNLSPGQIAVLAALRGIDRLSADRKRAEALVKHDPERARKVLSGETTILLAYNAAVRDGKIPGKSPPNRRKPPRGPANAPTTPHVPEAHEVSGVSTLADAAGNMSKQWTKTRVAGAEPEELPPDFALTGTSRMVRPDGTVAVEWQRYDKAKVDSFNGLVEAMRAHANEYRGLAEPVPSPESSQRTLSIYPLGDPHIGMMAWAPETGENNNLALAIERLLVGITLAVDSAPPSEDAWIVNLGDMLHAQNPEQRTPRGGYKLDVDGRDAKVKRACLEMCRAITEQVLLKHKRVHWYSLPGNHDPEVAAWLAMWLEAVYEREPRVTVDDGLKPYVYAQYGQTAFGFCHGDGAAINALPEIMAADVPEMWGSTLFHEWLTGHVHHQSRKDFRSCSVETFRILPPSDYWHRAKGFRARRSQHVITYHPEAGEINRATIDLSTIVSIMNARKGSR